MVLPVDKLHPARSLSPDEIALVEPLVIGAHGVERAQLQAGEPTVIIGMGPIGLAAAIFAKAAGANIICVDVNPDRLEFACNTMNLGVPITAGQDLAERLLEHFGQLPEVVIDASGNSGSMASTFQLAEHGGRIVFLGLFIGELSFDDPNFHRRELTLLASRNAHPADFTRIVKLIEDGQIDTRPWITHQASFDDMIEAFPSWLKPESGVIKAIVSV